MLCMIFEIDLANHASGRCRSMKIMYLDTCFPNHAKHLTICNGWTEYLETGVLRKVGVYSRQMKYLSGKKRFLSLQTYGYTKGEGRWIGWEKTLHKTSNLTKHRDFGKKFGTQSGPARPRSRKPTYVRHNGKNLAAKCFA